MKKLIICVVLMAMPQLCFGGIFSDYDESQLEDFRGAIARFHSANLQGKPQQLNVASKINSEIQGNCSKIGRTATYYLNECYGALKYTSAVLAESYLYYAKLLNSTDKKEEAKSVLRSIVISFSGENFKSIVKEAEFMLQDLEKEAVAKPVDSDNEKIKLQLELEKTKLELEKLKLQNRTHSP